MQRNFSYGYPCTKTPITFASPMNFGFAMLIVTSGGVSYLCARVSVIREAANLVAIDSRCGFPVSGNGPDRTEMDWTRQRPRSHGSP